ncbi:MAG: hypothetical protein ACTSRA_09900, partial [Promethearchaeota archaeon]
RLKYQGLKEVIKKILGELNIDGVEIPSDDKIQKLEKQLKKALSLPKKELLERIKNGSLYY